MDFGSFELQIFVSLIVVLATAFVALLCDFLKGNNEQLRERNIELRVRSDEREKSGAFQPLAWLQGLAAIARNPQLIDRLTQEAPPSVAPSAHPAPVEPTPLQPDLSQLTQPVAQSVEPLPPPPSPSDASPAYPHYGRRAYDRRAYEEWKEQEEKLEWTKKEELEQLAERAARIRARHESSMQPEVQLETPAAVPVPAEEPPAAQTPAVVESVPEPIAVEVSVSEPEIAATAAVETVAIEPAAIEPARVEPSPAEPSIWLSPWPETPAAPTVRAPSVQAESSQATWVFRPTQPQAETVETPPVPELPAARVLQIDVPPEVPLAKTPSHPPAAEPVQEPLPPPFVWPDFPTGLHEAPVLNQLLSNQNPFSGVVVAIGINDYDLLRDRRLLSGETDPDHALNKTVASMLAAQDFACRFLDDEYILIFPGESGSAAQKRLFQVSEKLWDFQLRSLGGATILFSWGGLEIQSETLAEGVASARERMHQSKRARKAAPIDIALGRRVVNG